MPHFKASTIILLKHGRHGLPLADPAALPASALVSVMFETFNARKLFDKNYLVLGGWPSYVDLGPFTFSGDYVLPQTDTQTI